MSFVKSEMGAVTVDWVVLTAALVGLGLATMSVVSAGVEDLSGDLRSEMQRDDIIKAAFDVQPFVYSPSNADKWPARIENMRKDLAGAQPDTILAKMSENLEKGAVRAGQEDEYAALQIVLEENGAKLPDDMPDMRDF